MILRHLHVFAGSRLDRAGNLRRDPEWLASQAAAPDARFVPLWQLEAFVTDGEQPAIAWQTAATVRTALDGGALPVLLGLDESAARFAVDVSMWPEPEVRGPLAGRGRFEELRGLAPRLAEGDAAILAQARAVIDWHRRHGYCAVCGSPSKPKEGGYMRECTNAACSAQHFPRTDPVVITLVVRDDVALLGRQARFPDGMYSALAGFIEPGETIEEAVAREVLEESGVHVTDVRYHSSQPWPFPASLMIGCVAEAVSETITIDVQEMQDVRWFPRDAVRRALEGGDADSGLRLPPSMAIAHKLSRWWAYGT